MKTKITNVIVWIIYALFVGVLIYGAILRTNAVSAEREYGENGGGYLGGRWGNYDNREGLPTGEGGRFGGGRGWNDGWEAFPFPDERGNMPFNYDDQSRWGRGDGWSHEPEHRFGPRFGEEHHYQGQSRWGRGDGWDHESEYRLGPRFEGDQQYQGQPQNGRGWEKWFSPSSDDELNDYAERYLHIDELF